MVSALGWLKRMLSFSVPFFKPHACHLFLRVQIQETEENVVTVTMKLLLGMKLDSIFGLFSINVFLLLQIKMDQTRRK